MTGRRRRWERAGVTLLELLVVIAVIGTLLGIGTVSWTQYQRRLLLSEASQQVAVTLRAIGENAITRSRGLDVSVDATTLTWRDTSSQVGRLELANGARVTLEGGGMAFSGRGLPIRMYQLEVSRDGLSHQVYLQPTGMVTIK